ncbi:class I SAM-dependent methyltransferase [Bacteriovoracales bacterium]|nr:class I SAM-dependent methyltransferase [Bacteriovoracales bacterium]
MKTVDTETSPHSLLLPKAQIMTDYITVKNLSRRTKIKIKFKELLSSLHLKGFPLPQKIKNKVKVFQQIQNSEKIFKGKKIVKCPETHLSWLHPMPSDQDLKSYYQGLFWDNKAVSYEIIGKNLDENCRATHQIKMITNTVPDLKHRIKKTLEFGAGHGEISYLMARLPNIQVNLLEPDKKFCNAHKEKGVVHSIFSNLNEVTSGYDLITASHSLEHVTNIHNVLSKFHDILNDEGLLFIEVPNCNESYFLNYKTDIPHTYFFNSQSISKLAKQHYFKVLSIHEIYQGKVLEKDEKLDPLKCADGGELRVLLEKIFVPNPIC